LPEGHHSKPEIWRLRAGYGDRLFQLVEAHGGRVLLRSLGEGKGACFTVKASPAGKPTSRSRQTENLRQKRTLIFTGKFGLLIIDDDPETVAILLGLHLGSAGAESIVSYLTCWLNSSPLVESI